MNKTLIQIEKNQYQVINEKGEISIAVANKEGSTDILIKENELEYSKNRLISSEEELKTNKAKCIMGEISMFTMMTFLFGLGLAYTTLLTAILFCGITYIPFKALHIAAFNTRAKRLKQRKFLKSKIQQLKLEIPELEKAISNAKKDIEFKRYYIKNNNFNVNTVNIISNYSYSNQEEKPKVLSIGQKKND